MISFAEFPIDIQYDDGQLAEMSLDDIQYAFKLAEMLLGGDELRRWQQCMWAAIARERNHPSKATLQSVLDHLEDYKRTLGRQYNAQHNMRTLLRYNEVERDIRWLSGQYELSRRSRPYFLGPRY